MKRKLPKIGDSVAFTRDFLMHVGSQRADWRGVILAECDYASPGWPMVTVKWTRGTGAPPESAINAENLCGVKSLAEISEVPK